jgi:molecular chaperone DnaJ
LPDRDYYNVLGVSREATPDELKRAYRLLAMRWHPDRNLGDAAAEQRFKDITEAYRVLCDPELRARYDRLGPLFNENGRPPSSEDVTAVVGRMWDNLWGRGPKDQGEDLKYTISICLEEVATGTSKEIVVPRRVRCGDCQGHGVRPEHRQPCAPCGGTGRSVGARLFRSTCYHCGGRGYVPTTPCAVCTGEGRIGFEDTLRIKIPPGVATGQKLKVSEKGNEAVRTGPSGDLYVVVNVTEHVLFRRRGEDLVADLPLTYAEVALGAEVTVPTLTGTTVIRVPAGTPHGKIFRLAGRGLPRKSSRTPGDLHLQVVVEIPVDLDDNAKARLSSWTATLAPERHPLRQAFDRAVQER